MKFIFIPSVTATRPLRTISVMTGSAAFFAACWAAGLGFVPSSISASPQRDDQIAEGIDRDAVAGMHHGGRGMLLDQCRACDPVAGLQRRAVVGRRVDEAGAVEIDRPLAAERLCVG